MVVPLRKLPPGDLMDLLCNCGSGRLRSQSTGVCRRCTALGVKHPVPPHQDPVPPVVAAPGSGPTVQAALVGAVRTGLQAAEALEDMGVDVQADQELAGLVDLLRTTARRIGANP